MLKEILYIFINAGFWGWGLIICRFYDGYKYRMNSSKIKSIKSAVGHSRDFGNTALVVDIFMLLYFIFKNYDPYMIFSSIVCILFVAEYWITLYLYYPYQTYPQEINYKIIKRPTIFAYFINSLQNDKTKKHL
jgi:hypothetical protein